MQAQIDERARRATDRPQLVVPETRPGLAQKATFVHPIPALPIPALLIPTLAIRLDAEAAAPAADRWQSGHRTRAMAPFRFLDP
jgi:hypothetical protein